MNSLFMSTSFNKDIGNWDTSNVTNINFMLYGSCLDYPGEYNNSNTTFNQDLTGWCVTNITSEPSYFTRYSALTNAKKPVWGTCP